MSDKLRNNLIKLAHGSPGEVREALLPILKTAGKVVSIKDGIDRAVYDMAVELQKKFKQSFDDLIREKAFKVGKVFGGNGYYDAGWEWEIFPSRKDIPQGHGLFKIIAPPRDLGSTRAPYMVMVLTMAKVPRISREIWFDLDENAGTAWARGKAEFDRMVTNFVIAVEDAYPDHEGMTPPMRG